MCLNWKTTVQPLISEISLWPSTLWQNPAKISAKVWKQQTAPVFVAVTTNKNTIQRLSKSGVPHIRILDITGSQRDYNRRVANIAV